MSEENVDIVRRVLAEWQKGNFAVADAFDPHVRVVWAEPIFAQQAKTLGIRETTRNMQELLAAYEHVTASAERIIDAGDTIVVVAMWRAHGRASGVELSERAGSVWTVSDGKVTRIVNYRDPADALEAAGLTE
jgi:ketosteroid isomerase-like protein